MTPEEAAMRKMERRIRDLEAALKLARSGGPDYNNTAMTTAHVWMTGDTLPTAEGTVATTTFIVTPIFPPDGMLISRLRTYGFLTAAGPPFGGFKIGLYRIINPDIIRRVPQAVATYLDVELVSECEVLYENGLVPNIQTAIDQQKVDAIVTPSIRTSAKEQYAIGFIVDVSMQVPFANVGRIYGSGFAPVSTFQLPKSIQVVMGITSPAWAVLSPRGAAILGG